MLTFHLVDHAPEARGGRIVRHAFEHEGGGAVRQRAVQDVAVARHPADVGRAPIDIAVVIVEDILVRHGGIDQIAAGRMHNALGFAGRARRVENEQRVLGLHLGGGQSAETFSSLLVQPNVAAGGPRHRIAGAADDETFSSPVAPCERFVGILFQRDALAAAHALIGGDDELRFGVLDAAARGCRARSRRTPPNGWRRCGRRRAWRRPLRESSAGRS